MVISKSPGIWMTGVFLRWLLKTKPYVNDAHAEWAIIKLNRAKKACKQLWIDIQDD
jgi:hypothetical protein